MHYIVLFDPIKQARQGALLSTLYKSLPSHGLHALNFNSTAYKSGEQIKVFSYGVQ